MSKVEIHLTGPKTGTITVDGEQLKQVVAFKLSADVHEDMPAALEVTQRFFGDITVNADVVDVTVLDNGGAREHAKA